MTGPKPPAESLRGFQGSQWSPGHSVKSSPYLVRVMEDAIAEAAAQGLSGTSACSETLCLIVPWPVQIAG